MILFQGMYPESHGIVNHVMFDETIGELFNIDNAKNDARWWKAEPVRR